MKKDYYEILGVEKGAAAADIKKKYRSLALKFHPDRVPEAEKKVAEERFKEISEAYGVLSDPKKRELYDQHGHAGIDQNFTSDDIFRGADFSSVFGEGGLGDIFGQIFGQGGGDFSEMFGQGGGGGGRSRRAQRGRDIQYETDLTFEEAYTGVTKKIKVPRNEFCKSCEGTGAKNGTALKSCPTCKGQGQVITSSGFFRMQQTCPTCKGAGKTITEYCPECGGKGALKMTRNIDVSIPAGVDNSSRLRVRNEGEIGRDGAGDLYIYIHVLPHEIFERNGNDLHMTYNVSFAKATLGAEVSIPTLDGSVSMKIPEATQSGKTFRVRGKGMPDLHGHGQGDLYVKVMVAVPTKLTAEQKQLLVQFAKSTGEDVTAKEGIGDKIKKVFK